ncbi:ATP-binding protein [Streptomyces coeruleoprunus]|uniref:ATP-binding protein n=1 Tax=Streptomyces coeruleoprunus TaxID=285563 RepID=A0ABV9XCH3_9ACTN
MLTEGLTAQSLDYLQRVGFEPPELGPGASVTDAPPALRSLVRIAGIGRRDKSRRPTAAEEAGPLTRDLLVGLHTYKVPLAFLAGGEPGRSSVCLGTWLPAGGSPHSVARNQRLLESALRTLYPAVDLAPYSSDTGRWPLGGLVMGVPTLKPPDAVDGVRQLDRLFQALNGVHWAALVLAQPVDETPVRDLRLRLINEMRAVQTSVKLGGVPSPLADHYLDLLGGQLGTLTDGQGTGAWRTAVYLLGDADGYAEVTSLWRGVFSGERSFPEPVRIWDRGDVPMLAASWAMPDPGPDAAAPGHYRQPFQHQTLLTSPQLAAYVHFPHVETHGFAITEVPDFDTVPPAAGEDAIVLGTVVERGRPTATPYAVSPATLNRHAFVTGVTGSGKTNTVFHLLRRVAARGVPFLVVEPAKTEYRVLLRDPELGGTLQVFTLGNEVVSPFRLNPFEVPEGTPVAVHLDLLRSVFHASFGMWTPLPQVLETALHGIYADRGWDITTGTNRRLAGADGGDRAAAFPTLSDLVRKVEEIVPRLGYEERVTGDLRAALRTRLDSLRTGGKGRMLDVRRSLPLGMLLGRPTVLELEGMGDDDDKAFMMGLLMIRLAEHRRAEGDVEGLRHLLVVEEAHRLLAAAERSRGGGEVEADVRGKAVETFTHLLSEIRAYGQGVVVVDQVPSKLAPDVLKNSTLKVAHRLVAGDDRDVLGDTMAMTERQDVALATLPVGRAAVFTDGEDAPLLLQVPRSKGGTGTWPRHDEVREHMGRDRALSLPPSDDCDLRCLDAPAACEAARALVREAPVVRALARTVLSAVQVRGGLERGWPDVVATVEPRRPRWVGREELLRCLARHGARRLADARGARAGWTYGRTASVADRVDRMLVAVLEGRPADGEVLELRHELLDLQGGGPGPFQGCARIWGDRPGPCLCREPVAELVASGDFAGVWGEARAADRAAGHGGRTAVWDVCQDAAHQLVEFPGDEQDPGLEARLRDVARCTGLCVAQQMLAAEEWAHPAVGRRALTGLLAESGHGPGPDEGGEYAWER